MMKWGFLVFTLTAFAFTDTAAEFGCPGEWKYCDQHCVKYDFTWGNCDENDSTCRCYGPRTKPQFGCPNVWIYCHMTCKKFGYEGVCLENGQCVCKTIDSTNKDIAKSP